MNDTSSHSFQVADVLIVSVDARGFNLAATLAKRGWKVVVIELSGGLSNQDLAWSDRLGPFLSWDQRRDQPHAENQKQESESYPTLWLNSGHVELGGPKKSFGLDHLRFHTEASAPAQASSKAAPFSLWPKAMMRSVVSSRMLKVEDFLSSEDWISLPMDQAVSPVVDADEMAESLRKVVIESGARLIDAERIVGIPARNRHLDRIEFEVSAHATSNEKASHSVRKVERTRSIVWMLSREESSSEDFVLLSSPSHSTADDSGETFRIDEIAPESGLERSMAWWRMRFSVSGLENAMSSVLRESPQLPPMAIIVNSIERPWTHGNLIVIEKVEESLGHDGSSVFDAWIRVPYWARMDHVYRDEQRLLVEGVLKERLTGCRFRWVTPSPIALTDPAVRLPFIVYSEPQAASALVSGVRGIRQKSRRTAVKAPIENLIFAGPETWRGLGYWGLKESETQWLEMLESLRREWDLAARKAKAKVKGNGKANSTSVRPDVDSEAQT